MRIWSLSLYASNEADADAISKVLQENEHLFRAVAPTYDYDLDWDSSTVLDDENEDTDPLYGAILNSIEGTNDRA